MKKLSTILLWFICGLATTQFTFGSGDDAQPSNPRRVILLVIDGLAQGAIERIPLPNLEKLKSEGTYYKTLYLPLAAHPRLVPDQNDPKFYPWSCSIPNPIMMTGTIFIGQPGIKETMLQYIYKNAGKKTAFVVNSDAYTEIAGGYDTFMQDWKSISDSPVLPAVQNVIETQNPWFIRIHMQSTGAGGYVDQKADRSIWAQGSEYQKRLTKADSLIGAFVTWLKENKHWEETVLFVCGDHGQSPRGGHAPYEPDGDKTSLILAGKGIKKNATFPYAEMIDLAPTITFLHQLPAPKYNQGSALTTAFINGPSGKTNRRIQELINNIMRSHHELVTKPNLEKESVNQDFLIIEQIGTWHKKFTNPAELLEYQKRTLNKINQEAKQ